MAISGTGVVHLRNPSAKLQVRSQHPARVPDAKPIPHVRAVARQRQSQTATRVKVGGTGGVGGFGVTIGLFVKEVAPFVETP